MDRERPGGGIGSWLERFPLMAQPRAPGRKLQAAPSGEVSGDGGCGMGFCSGTGEDLLLLLRHEAISSRLLAGLCRGRCLFCQGHRPLRGILEVHQRHGELLAGGSGARCGFGDDVVRRSD